MNPFWESNECCGPTPRQKHSQAKWQYTGSLPLPRHKSPWIKIFKIHHNQSKTVNKPCHVPGASQTTSHLIFRKKKCQDKGTSPTFFVGSEMLSIMCEVIHQVVLLSWLMSPSCSLMDPPQITNQIHRQEQAFHVGSASEEIEAFWGEGFMGSKDGKHCQPRSSEPEEAFAHPLLPSFVLSYIRALQCARHCARIWHVQQDRKNPCQAGLDSAKLLCNLEEAN